MDTIRYIVNGKFQNDQLCTCCKPCVVRFGLYLIITIKASFYLQHAVPCSSSQMRKRMQFLCNQYYHACKSSFILYDLVMTLQLPMSHSWVNLCYGRTSRKGAYGKAPSQQETCSPRILEWVLVWVCITRRKIFRRGSMVCKSLLGKEDYINVQRRAIMITQCIESKKAHLRVVLRLSSRLLEILLGSLENLTARQNTNSKLLENILLENGSNPMCRFL